MTTKKKPFCKYGAKCYRKNPQHFTEYQHDNEASESEDEPVEEEEVTPVKKRPVSDSDEERIPHKTPELGDESSPPKKKSKIEDFFQKKTSPKNESSKAAASEPKPASVSNYVRKEQKQADADGAEAADEEDAPPSPADPKENIKAKFLMEMPEDFYHFWEFAKSINSKKPEDAFRKSLGLQLVGPFDVLAGKCKRRNSAGKKPCYLRHWRYYYDPPEFLTVLRGDDASQFHMGYFRDDPKEMPVFVASNAAKENCTLSPRGENLFAALNWFIEDTMKKDSTKKAELSSLKTSVVDAANKHKYPLEMKTKAMKARDKKVNCKTFHGAGMVVPVDDNEVGYREVPETPGDLKKMLKKIVDSKDDEQRNTNFDPLMEILMLVQFANDECDYGEGLELGLCIFSFGGDVFRQTILNLLPLAYQLLGRHEYQDIITAHMADRKRTANLSQID